MPSGFAMNLPSFLGLLPRTSQQYFFRMENVIQMRCSSRLWDCTVFSVLPDDAYK